MCCSSSNLCSICLSNFAFPPINLTNGVMRCFNLHWLIAIRGLLQTGCRMFFVTLQKETIPYITTSSLRYGTSTFIAFHAQRDVSLHPSGLPYSRCDACFHTADHLRPTSVGTRVEIRSQSCSRGHSIASMFLRSASHCHCHAAQRCIQGCVHILSYCHSPDRIRQHCGDMVAARTVIRRSAACGCACHITVRRHSRGKSRADRA